MTVKKSGISLVMENFRTYIKQAKDITEEHKRAFSEKPVEAFKKAQAAAELQLKKTSKVVESYNKQLKTTPAILKSTEEAGTKAYDNLSKGAKKYLKDQEDLNRALERNKNSSSPVATKISELTGPPLRTVVMRKGSGNMCGPAYSNGAVKLFLR